MYIPTLDSEKTLIEILIPGILLGLSSRVTSKGNVKYTDPVIEKGTHRLVDVWNIYCDIVVTRTDTPPASVTTATRLWLASIPRFNENGLLELDRLIYHTAMRQRLAANVPICTIKRRSNTERVECIMRSENAETLESASLVMFRESGNTRSVMLDGIIGGDKVNVVGYLRSQLNSTRWMDVLEAIFSAMSASNTVMVILRLLMNSGREASQYKYIMPSCISTKHEHSYTSILDHDVSTEFIMLCQMLNRFISVESRELPPDDIDDYSNKIIDGYSSIMGKLFRSLIMGLGVNVIATTRTGEPRLFSEFIDAFTYNKWEIIHKHDSELQVSRIIEHTTLVCTEAALHEVIIIASPYSSGESVEDVYNKRMLHPSQKGYICMVRTADDISAGLKMYLASNCIVSHELYTFGISSDDDNHRMRLLLAEIQGEAEIGDRIWIHNNRVVGVGKERNIATILDNVKKNRECLGWSIHVGIIESRDYYGRMMCSVALEGEEKTFVDTREMSRLAKEIQVLPSNYSKLCHDVPFMNRMPVARTMLATKIMQKCIPADMPKNNRIDCTYLTYSQKPVVTTTKSAKHLYGYNVLICYTTYKGLGIEDGIIVNKASVERGLFMTVRRYSVTWTRGKKHRIVEYNVEAKINSIVKEGTLLATISYYEEDGQHKHIRMKHGEPYSARVADIELTFDTSGSKCSGMVEPRYLSEISVCLVRCKRFRTGDKLSSRSAQKAVAVSVMEQSDMPTIECIQGDDAKRYPPCPDIIINPLSVISRCTVSQDISSALGLSAMDSGASIVEIPFSHTVITCSAESTKYMNIEKLPAKRCVLRDGVTGLTQSGECAIGLEYYMVLNHIADEKVGSNSNHKRDDITGTIETSPSSTYVRYNWQELAAMIHAGANGLMSNIYNSAGEIGTYPYCVVCDRDTEMYKGECVHCGTEITAKVGVAKPLMAAKRIMQVLGADIQIGV